ncbi:phosphoribosylformylglycinamidine synthase I [Aquifex aeolicus]|uniref:Phosphoribosylformylglycinamidine synthase subunit PurQ n=1 Tax=Aquifex aeolicus (strain VF5) TaxID=224324 RepID=PURQ_AQUAE|nr:phosphoribosylformylglycinamidine synthase I [Aquifex aeolicus]O67190.1 RecName: Full=Phosphoribosylformylglycinamidine synthase subunit PurQ; Short=FGAM synthase; AltName: Full=Formylglycinamide ribonucleotide amidotransferase subunit I; Short=FGAR amidotransferase I; Short=FGAR-AT I; AltName: Full=Glutaminase PurQ; AltName: Full=Phosphoribosylformylglycinamidine synthase subunit I [Aquifex aeolicus VF5]AAC07146.1 phosphoribosyl formylglycinamidine synthase I [Aquifex aeolicus VF5]
MKFAVCVFPGSNCDYDTYYVIRDILEKDVEFVYWEEKNLSKYDVVVLPGGFSFGDYLRPGALAARTPLAQAIYDFAQKGKYVIGICNGFQILTELGLLPGALLPNLNMRFVCKWVNLRVENERSAFTRKLEKGDVLRIPIAHHDGRYYVPEEELRKMEENGQILFRYCDEQGEVKEEVNPNGSVSNIAGVMNKEGNVFGMMPHPERASEDILGSHDGLMLWYSLLSD